MNEKYNLCCNTTGDTSSAFNKKSTGFQWASERTINKTTTRYMVDVTKDTTYVAWTWVWVQGPSMRFTIFSMLFHIVGVSNSHTLKFTSMGSGIGR